MHRIWNETLVGSLTISLYMSGLKVRMTKRDSSKVVVSDADDMMEKLRIATRCSQVTSGPDSVRLVPARPSGPWRSVAPNPSFARLNITMFLFFYSHIVQWMAGGAHSRTERYASAGVLKNKKKHFCLRYWTPPRPDPIRSNQ